MEKIAKGPSTAAQDAEHQHRSDQCEVIASRAPESMGSGDPVSPAISLPISPSTDENYTTESDGNKRSNQSGSQRSTKPNCYECKHRGGLVGDAHSECNHPRISESDRLITGFALMSGTRSAAMKRLNISGDPHGIRNSWFFWPLNFDPVWLLTCDGFEAKD